MRTNTTFCRRRSILAALCSPWILAHPVCALAHGARVGSLDIDHPYATPTPDGARTGAVYFRAIANRGRQGDRLVAAHTALAEAVEFHRSTRDGDIVRMRAIEALELPPGSELKLRHGGEVHLMLVGLKAPLRDGQRFSMTLRFEKAGEREVNVWVQTPRSAAGHHH